MDIRLHVCMYHIKRSICFTIHSPFFSFSCLLLFLALFFRFFFSLIFLSSSSSFLSLFVDVRTAMFFVYPCLSHCFLYVNDRRSSRNEKRCGRCTMRREILFSISTDDENAENAQHHYRLTSNRLLAFFQSASLSDFFSLDVTEHG